MPSTRAWLALTAALALAAPLGALADPQRQPPAAPRSSFTNFDILKQLVKEHHAQTGKTVQARRNAGVVSRLGSFLDANAVRRRRLLGSRVSAHSRLGVGPATPARQTSYALTPSRRYS